MASFLQQNPRAQKKNPRKHTIRWTSTLAFDPPSISLPHNAAPPLKFTVVNESAETLSIEELNTGKTVDDLMPGGQLQLSIDDEFDELILQERGGGVDGRSWCLDQADQGGAEHGWAVGFRLE
jgi:hypothetical protein